MGAPVKKSTRNSRRPRRGRSASPVRSYAEYTRRLAAGAKSVVIDADPENWLDLGHVPSEVEVKIIGQTCAGIAGGSIAAAGRCFVQASNHARVTAYEHAHIEAFDDSTVDARGKSHIVGTDNARIRAEDSAIVFAHSHCHVQANGQALIAATDTTTVRIDGEAHVRVSGGVRIIGPGRPAKVETHPISRLARHLNF
ncbi:hypothetical protein [Rhodococcus sp. WAY2]|uniref:hypothetical protein n=1 Tax=Rhodococcus sp. WAY2 TaxID=2663121 RepID=UPI001356C048|nr:hypothetical protein [Rhodococcus sp. WAY2]